MAKIYTETFQEVWSEEGVRIRVGPDSDGLGLIEVTTPTEQDRKYFGKMEIRLSSDMARAVGKALIAVADANKGN